ncbi:hypothetical protein PIB30_014272 [Stylosanthes scabra]|uniref:AP2/ERF domain-containing protein n=1 Tax=Stylosanthes scabra TaxID=79078 RepID=A0ABU6Z3H3_9FABA|nr:hypothetical protein [Stylosanthes scabra]
MPLKSDGSLCIMEALTSSQTHQVMVPSSSCSSPKLEDFLGGATMGAHEYALACNNDGSANMLPFVEEEEEETKEPHNQHQMHQVEEQGNWVNGNNGMVESVNVNVGNGGGGNGGLKSLSLSMSPGCSSSSQQSSSHVTVSTTHHQNQNQISAAGSNNSCKAMEVAKNKRGGGHNNSSKQTVHRKSIETFGQRTSQYRGVTRHRWTGRYEAHLWDNSCKKEGQTRKGRQGGYDMEEKAARAYDLAALKYWGPSTHINFPLENYQNELEEMKNMNRQEYVAHLRRKSSGFSRGASMYRGVTRHHQHGRWQARIGRVAGNKDLYLGTFSTQEEAAEAYDVAAIKFRGVNAVTNFDISRYDVERIMASNTLLAGELARRNNQEPPKAMEAAPAPAPAPTLEYNVVTTHINNKELLEVEGCNTNNIENGTTSDQWKKIGLLYQQQQQSNNNSNGVCGNYRNSQNFCGGALQDLIGIDSVVGSTHHHHHHQNPNMVLDESNSNAKMGGTTTHFSNPSSLVTSLSNSSREGSPDHNKNNNSNIPTSSLLFHQNQKQHHHHPMLLPKVNVVSPIVANSGSSTTTSVVGSNWFPSAAAQIRSTTMSPMPIFAVWADP